MNKRILMVLVALFAACTVTLAQTEYRINQAGSFNNTFVIDCQSGQGSENNFAAYLYDSGGASGNYSANESYIRDIASTNAGAITIKFTMFNLGAGTTMTIKDGISQQILVSNATANSLAGHTFTSNRGSLQIIWASSSTTGAGFAAKIWCGDMCQTFQTTFNPSVSPTTELNQATGLYDTYYDICNGTEVNFTASTVFNNNHAVYDQDEASLVYHWGIINADNDTLTPAGGQTLNYTFTESGGYRVVCTTEDSRGCLNRNINARLVRVSLRPTWPAVSFGPDSICPGTTISLHCEPQAKTWSADMPKIVAKKTYIPDGNGTYSSSINFNKFADGATITSIYDIDSIHLNIEHSNLGDLSMVLQCPNGQMCLLHANDEGTTLPSLGWSNHGGINIIGSKGGDAIHLGLAPNPSLSSLCYYSAGEGYSYNFTPTSATPFGPNGPTTSTSYTDPCENVQTNNVLNAGNYGTYENVSSLIGCPLNGTWTLYVCDHSPMDNGYIFEWGLYFNESLYPNDTWSFSNTYPTYGYSWSGTGMLSGLNGSTNATAIVQNPDENNWAEIPYTFTATDNFGCAYDTTLLVHVKPAYHEDCCRTPCPTANASELEPCGFSTTLVANEFSFPGNTGEWTYTGPGTASFADVNAPETSVTVNVEGDYVFTWHEYYMGSQSCTGEASVTVNFARPYNATLSSIPNSCRSGNMIILSAPDFGVLSCTPITNGADAGTALNENARTFTPSLVTVPGTFRITNTIPDDDEHRCATSRVSSQTFTIYDELTVSNRVETCSTGYNPTVTISFNVNGVAQQNTPPPYYVRGRYTEYEGLAEERGDTIPNRDDSQQTGQQCLQSQPYSSNVTTFSFSSHSPLEYVFYVTDEHGCSNVKIPGYYECDCPNYAGTFVDYSPKIMCTGEVYWLEEGHVEGHGHDQYSVYLDFDASLSYIICTNPSDIAGSFVACKDANATSISLADIAGGAYNRQYYLVAVAGYGQYGGVFTATGSNRCRSVSQAVPLMWKESPVPYVTGNETCGLVMLLNGSPVPDGMNGYWTATPPAGVTNYSYTTIDNTTNTMNNAKVLSSHYGQVTYTWHVVNAECESSASAVYNFRQIPQPEAGPDITVCGYNAIISGASPTIPQIEGSSLQWTATGAVMTPANSIQPIANANTSGTYVITLTERNGECAGSDNMTITFISVPSPTTTPNVDTVCGQVAELQVNNTNPYNEGRWIAYDMNWNVVHTVSYSDFNNPNSPNSDRYPHCLVTVPIPDDQTEVEYIFKWSEPLMDPRIPEGMTCMGEAYKHVVFRKVPVVSVHQCGSSGNNVSVSGNSVELCGDVEASEGYTNFSWVCKNIEGSFSNPTGTSTTYTLDNSVNIDRYLDVDLYFTGTNGSCMSIDTMHVRFIQTPDASDSTSYAVCGLHYELTSENYNSNCSWFVEAKPNPDAQVAWTNTPHNHMVEGIDVSDYGVYTFKLIESINGVILVNDVVTVEFMEIPNPRAGEDFDVCGLNFRLNATSSHSEGDNISGIWTAVSGGNASFTDRTDPHTTAHYSAYGPATFRWTETNHPSIETNSQETCSASDDVVVTFYEPPTALINMNESDTAVCGLTFAYLRAENPGDGIEGFWYEQNPSTQFGPNNATVNNTITDVTVSSYGRHDFYWIECSGPADNPRMCRDTAGPWTIDFLQVPTAQISESEMTFCGYDGLLHADFNGIGIGRWSTNVPQSIITFDDSNDQNTLIHTTILNSGNYQYPFFEIYWTVQNTVYCTDRDTVKVVFAAVPSDSIKVIPPKCFGEPAILTAYADNLEVYNWDFGNGIIDSVINNAANGTYRAFVHWEDMQASHVVGLTTTNAWGCTSNIGSAIVEEPYRPEYTYNITGDTCGKGTGIIEFIDTTGYYAFFWIDTTGNHPITAADDFRVSNLHEGTYRYCSVYQTFNPAYRTLYFIYFGSEQCVDTLTIQVPNVPGALDESPVINVFGEFHDCAPSDVMLSVDEYASYMWSNGATNRLIHVTEPGYYNVTVADANGCTAVSNQVQIGGSSTLTTAPQISIVGMNSRNRNVVYWSALSDENVNAYNIYRENNVADVFELAATIPSNAQTYWIDETSQPSSRAYKYKVTAVDACGGESPMSDYHKTMHLTINRGIGTSWNLIWSHYEGFSFGSYRIYRGTSPSDLVMLEEIPSYQNSYTDYNVDNEEGLYYQVEVVRNIGSRTYLSSRSNIVSNDYVSNYTIVTAANNDEYGIVIGGGTYPMNTDITLYAIPNNGYHFSSWNDGNTENPRHVVVTGDATYVASFASNQQGETYTITVLSSNNEQGTVTGSGVYPAGALARISATANNGFVFTSWNDGNTENPRYITVTSDATYIANFADISTVTTYTITVLSANESYGTVIGGGTYAEGTIATIAAIANSGYVFAAWNDGNTENPRQVPVIANATYIASFTIGNGIEENIMPEISIYPNPTSGMLFIKSSEQISLIEFISITGQIISNVDVNSDNVACDIANFVPGMYFIRIYSGSQNAQTLICVQKFVKE